MERTGEMKASDVVERLKNRKRKIKFWDVKHKIWRSPVSSLINGEGNVFQGYSDGIQLADNFIPVFWTGLTDSSGRDVYEGDILKCVDEEDGEIYLPVIKRGSCFHLGMEGACIDGYSMIFWSVAGNVFENPELIEEVKKNELRSI